MSDEQPTAPFTFRPAPTKPARKTTLEKVEDMGKLAMDNAAKSQRKVGKAPELAAPYGKRRKRRAKLPDDVAVLKACLKQLRTLDPAEALRTVETLRVLFK